MSSSEGLSKYITDGINWQLIRSFTCPPDPADRAGLRLSVYSPDLKKWQNDGPRPKTHGV